MRTGPTGGGVNRGLFANSQVYYIVGIGFALLGVLFFINFFHIFSINEANAITETTSTETSVNLNVSISTPEVDPSSININLDPEADGTFASVTAGVDVSTNNLTGYTLNISTDNTYNSLNLDDYASATHKINALSGSTSLSDFQKTGASGAATMDMWGFTTDNNGSGTGQITADTYLPVPVKGSDQVIKVTDSPANESVTNVTFATKVDQNIPAGTYQNTVVFSAVTNTVPDAMTEIETMQDSNIGAACASISSYELTGQTYQLKDTRDNNYYEIAKLKDGNCWMIQNLRLDLSTGTAITSDESNVTSSWTPENNTQTDSTNVKWAETTTPTQTEVDQARSYKVGSGVTGDSQSNNTTYGNYYNWYAATAGTGTYAKNSGDATGSICPKGWQLPTNSGDKSWYNLLFTTYGLSDYSTESLSKAVSMPLNLIYTGGYNDVDARVYYQGVDGGRWSATADGNSNARYLGMYSSSTRLIPQYSVRKTLGFSVRCVLQ